MYSSIECFRSVLLQGYVTSSSMVSGYLRVHSQFVYTRSDPSFIYVDAFREILDANIESHIWCIYRHLLCHQCFIRIRAYNIQTAALYPMSMAL